MPSKFAFRLVYSTVLVAYFVVRETRKVKATLDQVLACVVFASVIQFVIGFGFREAIERLPGISFSAWAIPEMFVVVLVMVKIVEYLRFRRHGP